LTGLVPAIQRAQRYSQELKLQRAAHEQPSLTLTQLKNLFENLDDVFFSVDTGRGRLLQISPSCERISGWPAGIFYENVRFWKDLVYVLDRWKIDHLESELRAGKAGSYEGRILDRDGFIHWIEARLKPVLDDRGNLVRVDGVLMDISARKRSEEALRQSEEKYRRLFEESKDAIFISSPEGRFIDINPAGVELLGYFSRNEVLAIGNIQHLYFDPDKRNEFRSLIEEQGYVRDFEIALKRHDSRIVTVLETASTVRNETGSIIAYRGIWRDVTEQRKIEAQFLRAQRIESIGMLASGIAHDLNNILSPILMAAQLLKLRAQTDKDHKTLDTLERSARRGADLVKQILTFARGVEGKRGPLQLKHLIRDVEKIMTETLPKSVRIVTDVPKDLWSVHGDNTQLHQMLMNLCVNARDAMGSGGSLKVSARNVTLMEVQNRNGEKSSPGPYVMIEVADTGEGIPSELLNRIFDAFFTTKELGKGTGLGLSTVHTVVRNHSGFVDVDSTIGQGTTFTIYLPALPSSFVSKDRRPTRLPFGNGELLLIVDDEAAIRDVTRATLEAYGYRVLEAGNGEEGLRMFQQHREEIRAVLTDVNMPGMGGERMSVTIELLQPDTEIIFMSGVAANPSQSQGTPLERVRSFIQKPFTTEELLTVLRAVLQTPTTNRVAR
jgi:PAS domain S-box-containing protein